MTPQLVALLSATAVALAVPARGRGADTERVLTPATNTAARGVRWWAWLIPSALFLGWMGALLVLSAGVAIVVWNRDAPVRRQRAVVDALKRAAPLAYDLLATCLEVALSLPVAARVVAVSVGAPLATVLDEFAGALERGRPLQSASGSLTRAGLPDLAVAVIAADSGGPGLATALRSLAAEERAKAGAVARQSAKRAGVWAVGPLTLCFLPAFVLVGVVPVIVGLLGDLPR